MCIMYICIFYILQQYNYIYHINIIQYNNYNNVINYYINILYCLVTSDREPIPSEGPKGKGWC